MTGAGKVFKGQEFIADVTYDRRITNQYDQGVLVSQDAHLRIQPATVISAYVASTDKLTLLMSDGKKQDFRVASTDGECRCWGDLY
jgi:hypothetical protein